MAGLDRGRSLTAAIMAPARGHYAVVEPLAPCQARLRGIAEDAHPLVKGDADRIERSEIADEAVIDLLFLQFGHECAEQLVPDDEYARIVAIEITRVTPVMDAVVRGGVHDGLEPAGHFANRLGMNPELIDEVEPADEQYHRRVKPQQNQRRADHHHEGEGACPCLPQRRGQVVMLRGMVIDMGGPDPTDAVPEAMHPVIAQIVEHEIERDDADGGAEVERRDLP